MAIRQKNLFPVDDAKPASRSLRDGFINIIKPAKNSTKNPPQSAPSAGAGKLSGCVHRIVQKSIETGRDSIKLFTQLNK